VTNSGNSLVANSNLITKVYFPRMIVPGAAVGAGLVDFAIAFVLLVGMMVGYGVTITWRMMVLPGLIVLTTLVALSIGIWLSALNVKYRDVRYALPFLIQLWMFTTPIIYPSTLVPASWRWIMALNPLTGVVEGYRASLFGRSFDWTALGISTLIALVLLVYGAYVFRRMEQGFADIV
jgi:lipopolysaccharide transport system permease protein